MQKPQAVLFDLDGTLLDTARDLGNALNAVLAEHNMPLVEYERYRVIASDGAKGMLELGFGEQIKEHDFESLRAQFLTHYDNNICVDTCFFTGVEELLSLLKHKRIPWGVVTNKPAALTDRLLPHFAAFEDCAVVVSGDTLKTRKPDPEPLLFAADQMNINARGIWYLGDALRDIQAANAANMYSIIVEYGYISTNESLTDWKADYSIAQLSSLHAHL